MAQDARAELTRLAVLHHGPLFGYCRRRLGSESLAEDALQEVFLRAHKYYHTYDPARDARKWLFGIAHNVCVEVARNHGRITVADELPEPADNATSAALERLAREESIEQVRRELDRLPDRTRRILELRFFGQMTSGEIARLEDMNETAVRVALHRALETLRGKLSRGDSDRREAQS